jgi:hypothetical protein
VTRDRFEASKIQEVIVRDSIIAGRQSAADFFDNIDPLRTLAMRHTSKSMMTLVRKRPMRGNLIRRQTSLVTGAQARRLPDQLNSPAATHIAAIQCRVEPDRGDCSCLESIRCRRAEVLHNADAFETKVRK